MGKVRELRWHRKLDELGIKDEGIVKTIGIKVLWNERPVESPARAISAAMR
jgi:hypothetical protein